MKLTDLLTDIPHEANQSLEDLTLTGLSCDSRTLKTGHVFFALMGSQDNGLSYISQAEKKGAVAVCCDVKDAKINTQLPVIKVNDARKTLSLLASRFYDFPTRSLYLTGITGTNGKTTLTYLLEALWQDKVSGVIGTVNTRFAGKVLESTHTTPDIIRLNDVFSDMRKHHVSHVAMEVSSHALDQERVCSLDFDAAIFTNLTQDHLDYHKSMLSYFEAKKKLFTELLPKSSKIKKLAVINLDDTYGKKLLSEIPKDITAKTYSLKDKKADLFLHHAHYSFEGTNAELIYQNKPYTLKTNLIGGHNLQNIMAALLLGLENHLSFTEAAQRLEMITIPGRLERVGKRNVFVDYAHTPDALENVIKALLEIRSTLETSPRLITVFGCGGDRDRTKRPQMGKIAAKQSDISIITSDNPRTEDPEKIIEDILQGVKPYQESYNGHSGYLKECDRAQAIAKAMEMAKADDIILIAGKGHEDYQIIGTEKRHFDDREVVKNLLS